MIKAKGLSKTTKIFIDSSVLIAAAISNKGTARDLLTRGLRGDFDLYVSEEVLEECERNIARKVPNSLGNFTLFKSHLAKNVIKVNKKMILKTAKLIELKDAPIVAGAIQAKVGYLVSYDRKHLLKHKGKIETSFKIKVITPDELFK